MDGAGRRHPGVGEIRVKMAACGVCRTDLHVVDGELVDARFAFPLGEAGSDVALAPSLCAGLIGWRSLVIAGAGKKLGLYAFGAAAHIIAQVAKWQGRSVFAFTRREIRPRRVLPAAMTRPVEIPGRFF